MFFSHGIGGANLHVPCARDGHSGNIFEMNG